jgi:oligoendopeptidase F
MDALHATNDPTEKRQLAYLLGDCLEGYIQTAVSEVDDAVATAESKRTVVVDGKEVPFRQSAGLMSNETDRVKRLEIAAARSAVIHDVNVQRRASLECVRRLIKEDLGYPGYTDFYHELKQVDFRGFSQLMQQFMKDTHELYVRRLNEWTHEELGVDPSVCHRHDISFIMRAVKFDPYFPEERLKTTLVNTMTNLGIDLRAQSNIILDLEKRPTKSPRAFVVAAQVPQEVYLVVQPRGGRDDYAAILHESGHAEHFGNTSTNLPYEFRWLGDYSVTECFAFTMELLTLDEGWLKQHLNMPEDVIKEYQKYAYTVLFYLFRRYSSKLEYELRLHDEGDLAGKEHLYSEVMEKNLIVKHAPELYLSDVDPGFYCANYLRAWIMWAQLRKYLRKEFGNEWYNSHAAGAYLKKVWSLGQSLPAELLVKQFGYDGLDIGPLKEELFAVLGGAPVVA